MFGRRACWSASPWSPRSATGPRRSTGSTCRRRGLLPDPSEHGGTAGRMPLLLAGGRGPPRQRGRVGLLAGPAEGMIGWPSSDQGRQGLSRLWTPGRPAPSRTRSMRTAPTSSMTVRTLNTMLYAAPTGAADPAPTTEYVMVSAIEQGGQAGWKSMPASTSTRRPCR